MSTHESILAVGIEHPVGVLAILLAVLAGIFALEQHRVVGRLFRVLPALVFCYFVPAILAMLGVIPAESPLYEWIKAYLLPAGLLLLVLALDVPAVLRLGPKAVVMMLAGTAGVVIGGPVSLTICGRWLPEDAWQGMAALSGSWIGGAANFVAVGEAAGASASMLGTIVIVDVLAAYLWMGTLLYLSGHQTAIDRRTGADASAIRELERRMADFQKRVARIPSLLDYLTILALAFGGSFIAYQAGLWLVDRFAASDLLIRLNNVLSASTWKFIVVTAIGVALSFTRARNLEGAGASRLGSFIIYLLVACIGASADFAQVARYPAFVVMAFLWLAVHVAVLLFVGWWIRAPFFFVAVGSQANIGGVASAPIVAAAFHPALAPVGALLAVGGYALGTYCGLLCMTLLKAVAGQ